MLIQDQLAIAGGTSRAFRSYDTLNELMTNSGYNWAQVAAVYDECKLNAVTAKLIYMGTDAGALSQIIMSTAWDRSGITSGTFPWGYESYKTTIVNPGQTSKPHYASCSASGIVERDIYIPTGQSPKKSEDPNAQYFDPTLILGFDITPVTATSTAAIIYQLELTLDITLRGFKKTPGIGGTITSAAVQNTMEKMLLDQAVVLQ